MVRIPEMILGFYNWVSKVGRVTGHASRNVFSSGAWIHWSVNAVASIVYAYYVTTLTVNIYRRVPTRARYNAGAIVRVGTESRPKEVEAVKRAAEEEEVELRRVGPWEREEETMREKARRIFKYAEVEHLAIGSWKQERESSGSRTAH